MRKILPFSIPSFLSAGLIGLFGLLTFWVNNADAQLSYCTPPSTCSPAITANPTVSPTTYCQNSNPTITMTGNVTVPACSGGYTMTTFAPATPYNMAGATNAGVNIDDQHFGPFNIGFTFNYNCTDYTQFFISSNGYITFDNVGGGSYSPFTTSPIPTIGLPDTYLAPCWADLDPRCCGATVTYMTQGTAPCRRLVVEFLNMAHYSIQAANNTFQIVLYETTNVIEFRITNIPVNPATSTNLNNRVCGIEYQGGTAGLAVAGRNNVVWGVGAEGRRFTPNFTVYQYNWSNATNGFNSNNVNASDNAPPNVSSTYVFTVYDPARGCTTTFNRPVTVNPRPTFTSVTSNSPLCVGQTLQLNITGCTNCNTYSWTGPNGFASTIINPTRANVQLADAGTYTVTITSVNGCTATGSVAVTVNAGPNVTISVNPSLTICQGQSTTLTANGATTYAWSNGAGTQSITVNTAGTYTVTGTTGACTGTASVTVVVNPVPTFTSITSNSPLCVGQTLQLNINGCTNCNTYSWTGPNSFTANIQNPTRTNVQLTHAGTYTVTITSPNGCTATGSVAVTVNATPTVTIAANPGLTICQGQSTTLTASGATTYAWSNGGNTASITVNTAGTYTVTGTTGSCTGTASVTVVVNPVPTFTSITSNSPLCVGQTLQLNINGCTNCNTYSWSGPNGFTSTLQNPTRANVQPADGGNYMVTITSINGCTATGSVSVTVNANPTITINANPSLTICQGLSTTLTASGATTYAWSNGGNTASITVNTAGTYTVTGTTSGCTGTASVTVVVNPLPTFNSITSNSPLCPGQTLNLNINSCTNCNTYSWSGPNGFTSTLQNPTRANVQPADGGNYTVTITSTNGCTASGIVSVTVNPSPTFTVSSNSPVCVGQTLNLNINNCVNCNTYSWTGPGGFTSNVQNPTRANAQLTFSGTYSVTVTSTAGCTATGSVAVTVTTNPLINITANPSLTICQGQSTTLTASGATTYAWSNGGNTASITVSTAGTYTVTGTSAGCTGTASVTVVVNALPNLNISANPGLTICQGRTTILTVGGANTYVWNTGETTTSITVNSAGTFTVTGTNANGCTNTAAVTVVVNPLPTVSITANPSLTICNGQTTTLTASGANTYQWSNGGNTASITVNTAGNYTVTGTDNNGCTNTAQVTVVVNALPTVTIASNPGLTVCQGQTTILTASGANTYQWSNGGNTASITVNTAGTYTVTGTNGNGCTGTASVVVVVNPLPTVTITNAPSLTICQGNTTTLTANGAVNYSWSNGAITTSITVNTAGTYTVTGTNANGCTNTAQVTVVVNPLPTPVINTNSPVCQGQTLNLSLTQAYVSYSWTGPNGFTAITQNPTRTNIQPADAGTYSVTVTDNNGCSNSATVNVLVVALPTTPNPNGQAVVCRTQTLTYQTFAQPGVTYNWTVSPAGPVINSLTPERDRVTVNWTAVGTYTLSVTGTVGSCTSPAGTFTVTVNDVPPQPGIISGGTTFCPNGTGNYSIVSLPTATGYLWSINPASGGTLLNPQGNTTMDVRWTTAGTYTLSVVPFNACGNGTAQTITITVNPTPPAPVILTNTTPVCPGQANTIYDVTDIAGTTYNWVTPNGTLITSGQGTNQIRVHWQNVTPGNYNITVTPTRLGCVGASTTFTITVSDPPPAQPGVVSGTNAVCSGDVVPYSIISVPTAVNYTWAGLPQGATLVSGQGTTNIVINWSNVVSGTYTLSVTASNSCGTSPARNFTVVVSQIPVRPGQINLPPFHCVGASRTYSVAPVPGATSYTWTNSCGWQGTSNTNSITYLADNNSPCTITVTASNQCGTSPANSTQVQTIDIPPQPSPITGATTVCQLTTERYTVISNPNTSYDWTFTPAGPNIVSGQGTPNLLIDWGSSPAGNYTLTVTPSNSCGNGPSVSLTIGMLTLPNPPPPILGPMNVCAGQTTTYTIQNFPNTNYTWETIPTGPVLTPNGNSVDIRWNATGDFILLAKPFNFCGIGAQSATLVRVIGTPNVNAGANQTICGPTTVLTGSPSGGNWSCVSCPGGAMITNLGQLAVVNNMAPGMVNRFKYSVITGNCPPIDAFVEITNDRAIPGVIAGGHRTLCSGEQVTLELTNYTGNVVRWEISENGNAYAPIVNTTATLTNYTVNTTSMFRVVLRMNGSCPVEYSPSILVETGGGVTARVNPSTIYACKNDATLIAEIIPDDAVGTWSFVSGPATPNLVANGVIAQVSNLTDAGNYIFRWSVQRGNCPPSVTEVTVVRAFPATAQAGQSLTLCGGTTATFTGNQVSGATPEWRFVIGPIVPVIQPSGHILNVSGVTTPGDYVFRYTLTVPGCGSTIAEVYIRKESYNVVPQAGNDRTVCVPNVFLTGNDPAPGTGVWEFVSGPTTPILFENGRFLNATGLTAAGDYVFRWKLSYGSCTDVFDEVIITRSLDDPNANVLTPVEQNICESSVATVNAVLPPNSTGNWSFVSGPLMPTITTLGGLGSITGMTMDGTYTFRWTVTTVCGTSSTEVRINRFTTLPQGYSPANAGADQNVCETGFALVSGNVIPPNYVAEWRFVSGPSVALITSMGQFGSITNMTLPGPYRFAYTLYRPGSPCPGTTSVVTITRVQAPTPAAVTAPSSVCGTQVILTGNTPIAGVGTWTYVGGPAVPNVSQSGQTATVSGMNISGQYHFRYTIANPSCQPSAKDVTIQVSASSNAGVLTGDAEVCAGSNAGQVTLSGYRGSIVRWEASTNDFNNFTIVNNVTDRLFYNNLTQTTAYRAVVKNGSCEEMTSNIVTVRVKRRTIADAGSDLQICGNSVTLTGNVPLEATATWSILSSPASPTMVQANTTLVVSNMVAGTYVFNYTISNPPCTPSSDQVTITVSPNSVGGTLFSDRTLCKGNVSGVLMLQNHVGNVIRWEASADNFATFTPINNITPTQTYNNLTRTTAFRAIVQIGLCAPETSSVARITIVDPVVANAGQDQTICGNTVTLTGNDIPMVNKSWRLVSVPNQPSLNPNGNVLQVTGLTTGMYVFSYKLENAPCEPSEDNVIVTVSEGTVAGSVANNMTVCGGNNQATLVVMGFTGAIVRWESSTDNWQSVVQHANPSAEYTFFNLDQTTQYRAVIRSGNCAEMTTNHITVTVVQPSTFADGGSDRTVCDNTVTLTGNVPLFGTPNWTFVNGPASPQMTVSGSRAIVNNLTVPGVYVFQYSIGNAPCPVSTDNVQITVLASPNGGTLTGNATVCGGTNSGVIQLFGNSAPVIRWERSTDNFMTMIAIPNIQNILTYSNLTQTTKFRAVVSSGQGSCAVGYSTVAEITVNTPGSAGMITGTSQVCTGNNAGTLVLSGSNGQVVRWESSTGNGFSPIIVTSNTLNFTNLTQATVFRAVVRNMPCPEMTTSGFTVQVTPQSVGGQVNGSATVCSGNNAGSVTLSGHVGQTIRWESATDCQNFTAINGNGTILNYASLTQNTCFRAFVKNGGCEEAVSTVAQITVQNVVAGTLSGAQTVCAGSNQGTLSLSGQVGQIVGWESSTDNFITVNFIQNNTPNLTYANLMMSTQYRVVVSGGGLCPIVRSNVVNVTVIPTPMGGTLSGNATVCVTGNNGTLVLSGHSGNILHWESSVNGFQTVQTIANTNAILTYQNLTQTTAYRVIVGNNLCEPTVSTVATVTVVPQGNAGTLTGGATACGSASGTMVLNVFNGTIVRWESSTDNFQTVNPININFATLPYQNLAQTTRFRVVVNTGPCGVVISNAVEIRIDQPVVAGQLSASRTVCGGTNSGTLNLVGSVGNIVRWESSTNNFQSVSTIFNTTTSHFYQNLTQTTQYRVVVAGQGICGNVVSNPVTISVLPTLTVQATTVTGCTGMGSIQAVAQGGSGGFMYELTPGNQPPNVSGTFDNLDAGSYTVRVTDNAGCTATMNIQVSNQLTPPSVTGIGNITTGSAVITWGAILPNTTRYTLRYRMLGVDTWTVVPNLSQTSHFVTNLQNATTYEVEVAYRCENGMQSGFSSGLFHEFTTLGTGDCSNPTVPVPGGFFVNQIMPNSARANWNLVGGALGYIVSWGLITQNPNNWQQVIVCHPTNNFIITNLNPNTAYGVRIRTNCSNCTTALNSLDRRSAWSITTNITTPNLRDFESTDQLAGGAFVSVYPNPNKGQFTIALNADAESEMNVEVFDVTGRLVYRQTQNLSQGMNEIPFELKNIGSGVYTLRVRQGEQSKLLKLVIE